MRVVVVAMLALWLSPAAHAQWAQEPFVPNPTNLVSIPAMLVNGQPPASAVHFIPQSAVYPCIDLGFGPATCSVGGTLPRDSFAHVSQITEQITELNRQTTRMLRLASISTAIGDAIPNPGDAFAFRFNMAMIRDHPAAAVGSRPTLRGRVRGSP